MLKGKFFPKCINNLITMLFCYPAMWRGVVRCCHLGAERRGTGRLDYYFGPLWILRGNIHPHLWGRRYHDYCTFRMLLCPHWTHGRSPSGEYGTRPSTHDYHIPRSTEKQTLWLPLKNHEGLVTFDLHCNRANVVKLNEGNEAEFHYDGA